MCRLALDSLRYWVQECHVDGFRFDLAVALGRGRTDEFDPDHPFLVGLRTDPVLSRTKLIVEPWDVGHARLAHRPVPAAVLGVERPLPRLGARLLAGRPPTLRRRGTCPTACRTSRPASPGSRDLFGTRDRGPTASVNFVAAHDGFTLADLTAYDEKHNEDNGEDNNDGSDGNRSWNHGVEGPTDDEQVLTLRRRSMRNLLGTLLLSSGIPMINAGDELGRSQGGNNNPYNQDNATTWFDWDLEPWQEDLLATTRHLVAIRREHPALRQRTWAEGKRGPRGRLDRPRLVRRRRLADAGLVLARQPDPADARQRRLARARVGPRRPPRRAARSSRLRLPHGTRPRRPTGSSGTASGSGRSDGDRVARRRGASPWRRSACARMP